MTTEENNSSSSMSGTRADNSLQVSSKGAPKGAPTNE